MAILHGNTKHGYAKRGNILTLYRVWQGMMTRCYNKSHKNYHRYGARGIKVCKWWHSFENFKRDMGQRPKGKSLERRSNDYGYSPFNCCWETQKRQCRNKINNNNLTWNGKTQCVTDWAKDTGINQTTLSWRVAAGWSIDRILTTKPNR